MKKLKWWLVHGPERTGTTYMVGLITTSAKQFVSDWGLTNMLKLTPDFGYIKFDKERALRDISNNILDNADPGGGDQIDLVYKQAALILDEFEKLKLMWGNPERIIFCYRDPAGYMASALKKFPKRSLEKHQWNYIKILRDYKSIGGEPFEYSSHNTSNMYLEFLKPLNLGEIIPFEFRGDYDNENTSAEMWEAYYKIKSTHSGVSF